MFFFFLGVLAGLIFGLFPGIHTNTIISILSPLGLAGGDFSLFILGLIPAHIISSFVPSIFLGTPDEETVISTLAGQKMLARGQGLVALKTVLFSIVIATLLSTFLFYFSLNLIPTVYSLIRSYVPYVVLLLSGFFILRTKNPILSLFIFILSGMLGYYSLNSGINDVFLPLFSGMFAMGSIITYSKSKIPEQQDNPVSTDFLKFTVAGVLLGMFSDLLPAVSSPSQISSLISAFMPMGSIGFLAASSSIIASREIFSFASSVAIDKSRNGATLALVNLIDIKSNLLFVISLYSIGIAIASFLVFHYRKIFIEISKLDFSKINIILGVYLFCIVAIINGSTGVIIFILASAVGFLTIRLNIERTNMMGSIIIPTLLLLFKIFII